MPVAFPTLKRFRRDDRGSVVIIFGLSATILFVLAGLAIDSSRAYNVSFKLQAGLDAAALAAAQLLDDPTATQAQYDSVAEAYFKAYLERLHIPNVRATNITVMANHTDSTVNVKADITFPALFGLIGDADANFTYTPEATVMFKPKKIEMALVLDITGSMCDVPPAFAAAACASGAKISALKTAATDIVNTLAGTNPGANAIKMSVVPYAASVNLGGRAGGLTGGASVDGCLVERQGGSGFKDDGPSSLFPVADVATFRAYSCPNPDVLPLTDIADLNQRNQVLAKIASLSGFGGTAGHIGLAWGWYTVSPNWSGYWPGASAPRPFDPDKTIKSVILMTDGMFNTSYKNGGEAVAWPDPASGDSAVNGTSGNQALKICKEMQKGDNQITIYTVGFQTPPEAEALLKECSGEENFYNADNAAQLSSAFKDIAKRLTNIRVSG